MAEVPAPDASGGVRVPGAVGAVARRSRAVPGLLAAFVAGTLLATALRPVDDGPKETVAAAGEAPGGVGTSESPPGGAASASGAPLGAQEAAPSAASGATAAGAPAPGGATATNTGGATGATAAGAPTAPRAASSSVTDAPPGGNGGATFRGVTDKAIKASAIILDSNTLGTLCPRCGNGQAAKGASYDALTAAWRRDGLLPIYGRDLSIAMRPFDALSAEERRNACVKATTEDKPFLVLAGSGANLAECVAQEFKTILLSGQQAGDDDLLRSVPRVIQVFPTIDRTWRNYVVWLERKGLLKNQVLGMYSSADSSTSAVQKNLTRSFREPLQKAGYKLAVDMTYDVAQSAQSDSLAVQRFRSAGVTVALIFGALIEPAGFQQKAEAVGYRPKYPIAEVGNETTDAVADIGYNADAQDGNFAMRTAVWEWKQRRPAVPVSPKTAYCLKAYQDHTKRVLDVFDNDAEIHTIQHVCAVMEVLREALVKAGPNLNETSFFQGLYTIKNFQTSDVERVSFGPGKNAGSDVYADAQFKKARWEPHNNYWNTMSPWYGFFLP